MNENAREKEKVRENEVGKARTWDQANPAALWEKYLKKFYGIQNDVGNFNNISGGNLYWAVLTIRRFFF